MKSKKVIIEHEKQLRLKIAKQSPNRKRQRKLSSKLYSLTFYALPILSWYLAVQHGLLYLERNQLIDRFQYLEDRQIKPAPTMQHVIFSPYTILQPDSECENSDMIVDIFGNTECWSA